MDAFGLIDPADIDNTRKTFFETVPATLKGLPPLENERYRLSLSDLRYNRPVPYSLEEQKKAILGNQSLNWNLRGTWTLTDKATGKPVDAYSGVITQVPYLTNRGTFIRNGNEYTISRQARLKPGVYARQKANGELESHINPQRGTGRQFRIRFEPATGKLRLNVGQANIPFIPFLRLLGVPNDQLREQFGRALYDANGKEDVRTATKILDHFAQRKGLRKSVMRPEDYRNLFSRMHLDPAVTARTLGKSPDGQPYSAVTPKLLIRAARKLINIQREEEEADDRDSLANQVFFSVHDFLKERIDRDAGGVRRNLLWKATNRGNLGHLTSGSLNGYVQSLLDSSFANNLEEINPLEILDQHYRVVRIGEGGISSADAIPEESRNVQPSQVNFIDVIRGPESSKIGTDTRISYGTRRQGQKLVSTFLLPDGGQISLSPEEVVDSIIAFPHEMDDPDKKKVKVLDGGKFRVADRSEVQYIVPNPESMFSIVSNMVPFLSSVEGLRLLMGSKMLLQALPLKEAEAPLVQSAMPDNPDRSFEDLVGRYLGAIHADAPGRVVKMTPNAITVKHQDGTTKRHELYQNLPYNRKTTIHNTPLVSIGDRVDAGTVLAQSNFTDNRGTAALGKNLSVAYMVFGGRNYEDGTVISESAAKKLSSESLYTRELSTDDGVKFSKNSFLSVHPAKFTKDQLSTLDENGVVTPGTVVQSGDPLILALGEKRPEGASLLYRSHRVTLPDKSVTWNHHDAGLVTDVVPLKRGWKVAIKAYSPMHVGDKMCFSDDTELLTRCGWKKVSKIHEKDLLATLNPDGEIEYQTPTEVHVYDHDEDMFYLAGPRIDMLVTLNHRLWVAKSASRTGKHPYHPVPATFFHDSSLKWLFKQTAKWRGTHFDTLRVGTRDLDTNLVLTFLGYYLALQTEESRNGFLEMRVLGKSVEVIREIKNLAKLLELDFTGGGDLISIALDENGKALFCDILKGRYPRVFYKMDVDHINVFLKTLFTGKCGLKEPHRCAFTSRKLADLVQILTMKLGYVTTVTPSFRRHYEDMLPEHECNIHRRPPRIWRQPNGPTTEVTIEKTVAYTGKVYCVTVPNHLVCCRRNGLFHWSHNSGRYGNKGVITAIVPDDRMPHTADGEPVDVILNPLTVISRRNPAQLLESALGKIARKTGKPYRVRGFSKGNAVKFVMNELRKNGMSDTEDLYDPIRNARIPNVFRGVSFFMKLHHTTESKESGRAVSGQDEIQYTSDRMPAKGGKTGAKRLSVQDINALLSHGASAVVRDAHLIKARRNDDYWRALRLGYNLPTPGPGFIHDKFMAMLAGSGVNVKKSSGGLNFLALTKKDVDNLTNGDVENPETVDIRNLNPKKGGLFDVNRTGGLDGFGWSTIKLAEPMPNPLMEKPIREMLGLTQANYEQILGGGLLHKGLRGPKAIVRALESYNVDKNIVRAREDIRTGKGAKRDRAVKLLGYLTMFKKSGIKPADLIWDRVPVLPPAFRPISQLNKKVAITADANGLYRDVFYANKALEGLKDSLPDENLVDDRLSLYNSIKAVVGLGDPIGAKSQQQNLKGLLAQVFGKSPKFGLVQRKLISVPQDLVGRATIIPDPALDIDEVGLPERVAWEIYAPFIMRRLVRSGAGASDAAIMISKRAPQAREALLKEFEHRPVLINRAPVLHKFGIQAAWPTLTKGGVLRIPPLLTPGFGADFDGDTMQYFVPVSEEARRQAIDFMLPSKNIIDSTRFAPQLAPRHEFLLGLYRASKRKSRKPLRVFRSERDVISAFRRGEIGINDPVSFPS